MGMLLHTIASLSAAFHLCSHLSFAVFRHYPCYRSDALAYTVLRLSDLLAHVLIFCDTGEYIFLLWALWHGAKLADVRRVLRDLRVVNYLEALSYVCAVYVSDMHSALFGVLLYAVMRAADYVW
eukprot:TRINITY_DN10500_c0_g1_i1.p2 TRINITY_DN10500_c0_g1~~TRINITY_DN10500_c0_g1_i1.p2  ORF type:complete len:124 (+),score=26.24 TRINITY_DN10500_c0_g1_i1:446-817(+)